MGFDVGVGLFLCDETYWPAQDRRRFLDDLNARLDRLGLPAHREPESAAAIDPPLPPGTDPCLLGASMGSYSSHARRADRLDWFARHVAVRGEAPATDPPYGPDLYQAYDTPADRTTAFDHLLAACGQDVVVLPRRLDRVILDGHGCIVSAHRLRAEALALGYALRTGDAPAADDPSFAGLTARIADDDDVIQRWAEEASLCHWLLQAADDVLRTGALGLTS